MMMFILCAALDCILFCSEEEWDKLVEGVAAVKQALVEEVDFIGDVLLMGAEGVNMIKVSLDEACGDPWGMA